MAEGEDLGAEILKQGETLAKDGAVPPVAEATPAAPPVATAPVETPATVGLEAELRKLIADLHARLSVVEKALARHPTDSNTSIVFGK